MRRCRRALQLSSMLLSRRQRKGRQKRSWPCKRCKQRRQNCVGDERERSGSRRQKEDKRIAALPDEEREKDVEAAEKIAEQETFRRSVAAHMSGQQGTSSAYMI
jgi:hypothetical protein